MNRWAYVVGGVIDSISFEDQTGVAEWVAIPDDVFAGFTEDGEGGWTPPVEPPPPPSLANPPAIRACALRNFVADGEVSSVGGSFNVSGMLQMDVGTFWCFLFEPITGSQPEIVPNNGIHVSITEWNETDFMIETRDHAGGTLLDPVSFGFTLYQF